MQRWYPDRIGGMFTDAAEQTGTAVLQSASNADYRLELLTGRDKELPNSIIQLGEQRVFGWVKCETAVLIGAEVYLATLATLWGAPAAPLLMLDSETAFSPACVSAPRSLDSKTGYRGLDPYALGAAGQFRLLLNDHDGEHNMVRCGKTNRFHLIDYAGAEPAIDRTAISCERFISNCLDILEDHSERHAQYKAGANLMSRRITATADRALVNVAERLRDRGAVIDPELVDGLIRRKDILERPQFPRLCAWDAPPRFR